MVIGTRRGASVPHCSRQHRDHENGGWLQELDAFWGEEWPQRLHELAADAVMVAVVVHVAAVLLMQRLTDVALIRAMITVRR